MTSSSRDRRAPESACWFPHGSASFFGVAQPVRFDLSRHSRSSKGIIGRCAAVEPLLRAPPAWWGKMVGLRPVRPSVRVEAEGLHGARCVHNYGHGRSGVSLSWGCAEKVPADAAPARLRARARRTSPRLHRMRRDRAGAADRRPRARGRGCPGRSPACDRGRGATPRRGRRRPLRGRCRGRRRARSPGFRFAVKDTLPEAGRPLGFGESPARRLTWPGGGPRWRSASVTPGWSPWCAPPRPSSRLQHRHRRGSSTVPRCTRADSTRARAARAAARRHWSRPGVADGSWQRRRRVDPHPRRLVRPGRAQALAGPRADRPGGRGGRRGFAHEFALTRTVRDAAALLDAVSGPAPGDPLLPRQPVAALRRGARGPAAEAARGGLSELAVRDARRPPRTGRGRGRAGSRSSRIGSCGRSDPARRWTSSACATAWRRPGRSTSRPWRDVRPDLGGEAQGDSVEAASRPASRAASRSARSSSKRRPRP